MNVIAVLSGECKQTGRRRGGKERTDGEWENTATESFKKKQSGEKGNDWLGIWLQIQQQSQTQNMEAHISVKWRRWIIISWMDKNVLIEWCLCVCAVAKCSNLLWNEKKWVFCRSLLFIWLQKIDLFKISWVGMQGLHRVMCDCTNRRLWEDSFQPKTSEYPREPRGVIITKNSRAFKKTQCFW